jgi:hypothetical protein
MGNYYLSHHLEISLSSNFMTLRARESIQAFETKPLSRAEAEPAQLFYLVSVFFFRLQTETLSWVPKCLLEECYANTFRIKACKC